MKNSMGKSTQLFTNIEEHSAKPTFHIQHTKIFENEYTG